MTTFWIVVAVIEFLLIAAGVVIFVLNAKKQEKIAESARQMSKGKINLDDIPVSGTSSKNDVIAGGLNLIKSNLLTFVESTKQNTVVLADAIEKQLGLTVDKKKVVVPEDIKTVGEYDVTLRLMASAAASIHMKVEADA